DGLMRITAQTLSELIGGAYDSVVESFVVVDCRFDYEHEGGHIPGAINLNTDEAIERAFLVPDGDGKVGKKIIVFHCEFSVKRAPTFAKQFRSKDRAMNNAVYPRIHYPEVYILEGGYSNFYTQFS
ncbi:Rhodanese-like protein, partial [Clavulina sp. PMI_390]